MNQYEVMYVIDTALEDQVRNDLIARFSSLVAQNGGNVDRVDEWGKRRLAYSINYKTEGYYVLMFITAPSDLPRELERNLQISESVLRYLVIRFEGVLPPKREPLKPFVPAAPAPTVADAEDKPAEAAPVEEAAAPAPEAAAEVAVPVVEAELPAPEATTEPEPSETPKADDAEATAEADTKPE